MKPELVKTESQKSVEKPLKIKIESITPDMVIDCWRLLDRSIRETHAGYPDLTRESPDNIRITLFKYMMQPGFVGFIARVGRKPVGHILSNLCVRQFGSPRLYAYIWNLWVEPEFRKKGILAQLANPYFRQLKEKGCYAWEAEANEELTKLLTTVPVFQTTKLLNRIGGKV